MNTISSGIPILRTARLQMVAPQPRHFEAFAVLHADVETMRHVGHGQPLDRVEAWLHLAMLIGHWDMRGYGIWIVEQSGGGDMVGRVGLFQPADWDEPELNWLIAPAMRGQGLALEAGQAARDFAFGTLGFPSLISLVRPGNTASSRVALKLGAELAETIDFLGQPMHVYRYRR